MKYLILATLMLSTTMASAITRVEVAHECGKYFANKPAFHKCMKDLYK